MGLKGCSRIILFDDADRFDRLDIYTKGWIADPSIDQAKAPRQDQRVKSVESYIHKHTRNQSDLEDQKNTCVSFLLVEIKR